MWSFLGGIIVVLRNIGLLYICVLSPKPYCFPRYGGPCMGSEVGGATIMVTSDL